MSLRAALENWIRKKNDKRSFDFLNSLVCSTLFVRVFSFLLVYIRRCRRLVKTSVGSADVQRFPLHHLLLLLLLGYTLPEQTLRSWNKLSSRESSLGCTRLRYTLASVAYLSEIQAWWYTRPWPRYVRSRRREPHSNALLVSLPRKRPHGLTSAIYKEEEDEKTKARTNYHIEAQEPSTSPSVLLPEL